jgi:hypothetical protein
MFREADPNPDRNFQKLEVLEYRTEKQIGIRKHMSYTD